MTNFTVLKTSSSICLDICCPGRRITHLTRFLFQNQLSKHTIATIWPIMSGLFDRWRKEMKTTFITCRRGQDTAFCLCHVRLQLLVLAPVMRAPGAASNALVSSYHNDLEALDMPLNFCRYIACVRRDNIVSLCCCSIIACPGAILVRFHFTDDCWLALWLIGSLSSDESRTTPFVSIKV